MAKPNQLTLSQAAGKIADGELSASALVESCLNRIEARESVVKAWAHLDADNALKAAADADAQIKKGKPGGPLHGIPIGIKDIYDVAGMPTAAGTSAYPRTIARHDANSVARLREAGAIVLGKTVTTAFAMGDPGATTNPWNAEHTPGGSSSGSGAAVADRMCMAALGTQTAGSVIRPCSFNGLAGIKPSHGSIDVAGVIALSWRLDHVGMLTRSVVDAALLWQVLAQQGGDNRRAPMNSAKPQRLWRASGLFDNVTGGMCDAMQLHCDALKHSGVEIIERPLPPSFDNILEHHQVIMASEAAASHHENYQQHSARYPPRIKALIEEGLTISATDYLRARQHRRTAIAQMQSALEDVDGLLCPAAAEPAPHGLNYTGERAINVPSSYLGLPVVAYPIGMDPIGLPLGAQIMGRLNDEDNLLAVAAWCEGTAGFEGMPE